MSSLHGDTPVRTCTLAGPAPAGRAKGSTADGRARPSLGPLVSWGLHKAGWADLELWRVPDPGILGSCAHNTLGQKVVDGGEPCSHAVSTDNGPHGSGGPTGVASPPPLPRLQLSLLSEVLLFPSERLKHRDLSCWILEMLHSGYAMAGRKSSV